MGTNGGDSPIELSDGEIASAPKFAVTDSWLFETINDAGKILLRFGDAAGNGMSGQTLMFDAQGKVLDLRIIARKNIALVLALVESDMLRLRAAVGRVTDDAPHKLSRIQCPVKDLPGVSPDSIVDIIGNINDDGTSDDRIIVSAGAGSGVSVISGHHPAP